MVHVLEHEAFVSILVEPASLEWVLTTAGAHHSHRPVHERTSGRVVVRWVVLLLLFSGRGGGD
jgi:hypothetical protein